MADSDGGHVWPPRASDLRIQELTAGGPEASKPDNVFAKLRTLGYTGGLDDMWKKHLAALGITDTSEPFTTSLAGGSAGGLLAQGYSDVESQSAALGGTRKGFAVDSTGTKWITNDIGGNVVRTGTMSPAWDASTLAQAHSIAQPVSDMRGLWTDGSLYVTCSSSVVYYGTMSTPWDASTMGTFANVTPLSTSSECSDIAFSDDGFTFLVLGFRGDVHSYTCSTAFDLSTLNTTRVSTFDLTTISPTVWADDLGTVVSERWSWNADGTKFVTINSTSTQKVVWECTTPWDATTADLSSWNYQGPSAGQGIYWDETAEKMAYIWTSTVYILGEDAGNSVSQTYPVSGFRQTDSINMDGTSGTIVGCSLSPDGTKYVHRDTVNDRFQGYTLSTPWDFSTALVSGVIAEDASMVSPQGMCMSQDGLKMYESDSNEINEWTLSTAWDVTTATLTNTKVIGTGGAPSISSDGTKMFLLETNETMDSINLSTPYDVSTATADFTLTLSPNGGPFDELYDWITAPNPKWHVWNADGTRLLIVSASRFIYEYDVTTAWDINTLSYSGRLLWTKDPITGIVWSANEDLIAVNVTVDNVNILQFDSRLS